MGNFNIPLSYNEIDPEKLNQVLETYRGRHHNEIITDFEGEIRSVTGSHHALALNSGTAGIHLALRLLEIGPGDEVLTSTFTYIASANPILYQGATPVFIDSEISTWNMDPDLLETAIKQRLDKGKKPKAILVVHCYGMPARMDRLAAISEKFEIPLIEDAAEALGSTINDKHVGTFGTLGILSFNNNKILTTYGGGALLSKSGELDKKARFWASQSREDLLHYLHKESGFNYRIGPLNAACGLAGLKNLQQSINSRRATFDQYRKGLLGHDVGFAEEGKWDFSNRWITTAVLKDEPTQVMVARKLLSEGMEIRPVWNPMHKQPLFKDYPVYSTGVSEKLFSTGICLPSNSTHNDIESVLHSLKTCLG